VAEFAQRAYDAASGDKQLAWIQTHNHIELYDQNPYVDLATSHAVQWLDARTDKPAGDKSWTRTRLARASAPP
jgi:uncharacterized protein